MSILLAPFSFLILPSIFYQTLSFLSSIQIESAIYLFCCHLVLIAYCKSQFHPHYKSNMCTQIVLFKKCKSQAKIHIDIMIRLLHFMSVAIDCEYEFSTAALKHHFKILSVMKVKRTSLLLV